MPGPPTSAPRASLREMTLTASAMLSEEALQCRSQPENLLLPWCPAILPQCPRESRASKLELTMHLFIQILLAQLGRCQRKAQRLAARLVGLGHQSGQRPYPQDVALTFGDGDGMTGIEQVEIVGS